VEAERLTEEKVAVTPSTTVAPYRIMTGVQDGNQRWRQTGLWRRPSGLLSIYCTCTSVALYRSMTGVEDGNQRWRRTGLRRREWPASPLLPFQLIGTNMYAIHKLQYLKKNHQSEELHKYFSQFFYKKKNLIVNSKEETVIKTFVSITSKNSPSILSQVSLDGLNHGIKKIIWNGHGYRQSH
jgi:hypothetical protein